MPRIPIVHAHDIRKQIPREKKFLRDFLLWDFTTKNCLRLRWKFKLNTESREPANEEEMFSLNKVINALRRSRGNINRFTTFKPSG